MAIRQEIRERTPLDNVEVEYARSAGSRRERRPGFNRARLLDIKEGEAEIAAREAIPPKETVQLTFHVKTVRDFLKVTGKVKQRPVRITVLKQPAYSILLAFEDLSEDELKKVVWTREQLVPKRARGPIRRHEEATQDEEKPAPAAAPAPAAPGGKPAVAVQKGAVERPVALLELIDSLDNFHVTEDLITAVIEAAEAGMDVEVLYPVQERGGESAVVEEAEAAAAESAPPEGSAKPMNIYRLASNTRLPFSAAGEPVGPSVGLFYLSSLRSPENCFAVRLETDAMAWTGSPTFDRGSVLVFSTKEKVSSGEFAFVKSRLGDRFVQVFFDKPEEVRLHPLNPSYPEHVLRRSEIKVMCRLVGGYRRFDSAD